MQDFNDLKFGPQPETTGRKVAIAIFNLLPPALFLALLIWHGAHAHRSQDPIPAAAWAFGEPGN